jgi:hypothetical protein
VGADQFFVIGDAEPVAAEASDYAAPQVATAQKPAVKPQPATQPTRLAQHLRDVGKAYSDKPLRDAFAAGSAWIQPVVEVPKAAEDSVALFRQNHRLTGVLSSSGQACAMVNGTLVIVGQTIGGYRLVSIGHRSATFESDSAQQVQLTMDSRSTALAGAGE